MNWRNWSCSTSARQLIDSLFSLLLLRKLLVRLLLLVCCCLHLMKLVIVSVVLLLLLLLVHVQWLLWPHELLLIHSKVNGTKDDVIISSSWFVLMSYLKLLVEPLIGPFLFWFIPIAPPPTLKTDLFEPYWAPLRLNWCCSYTDTLGLYFWKLK